ncbi:MAG: GGDEF domain-containing protein, partial [Oscillospiraceae bacterium]
MLARFGGEEFAMLFEGVPMQEVLALLETLRQAFAQQSYDFTAEAVTVSIGGALWVPGQSAQKLFDCADAAMYHAKALGKNQTALWES